MPHTPPETVEERFKKAFNPAYYAHSTWIEGNEEQLLSFIHQEITRAKEETLKEVRTTIYKLGTEKVGEFGIYKLINPTELIKALEGKE